MATVTQYTATYSFPQVKKSSDSTPPPVARVLGIPPAPCEIFLFSKRLWMWEPKPVEFYYLTPQTRAALEANRWRFVDCKGGAK